LGFAVALQEVWSETQARRFTVFVFLSMLAYSMQDLILEPFAGVQFGYTPGASTKLAGVQHAGVFSGMVLVALAANPRFGFGSLRAWVIGGCIASCLCLLGLAAAGTAGGQWPLQLNVFALGIANGAFAIAAIGSMMTLAGAGRSGREGIRMGLWGAAQAIAFAAGGFVGAAAVDALQLLMPVRGLAYASVFALEALAFLAAARLANSAIPETPRRGASPTAEIAGRLATRPG
jgi:BCD family chlorophyll transporter-like MFS transporter